MDCISEDMIVGSGSTMLGSLKLWWDNRDGVLGRGRSQDASLVRSRWLVEWLLSELSGLGTLEVVGLGGDSLVGGGLSENRVTLLCWESCFGSLVSLFSLENVLERI